MNAILGLSAFYHDSAAALVVDGRIVAAAQEERFTRKKHDPAFPANAIEYCLREAGLKPEQLNYVAFYDKPLTKFDRLLETYLAYAPAGFRSFRMAMPLWLKDKLHMRRTLREQFRSASNAPLVFTDHHESHAASAFFPSPYDRAAVLTIDGVGEWSTVTYGVGEGNKLRLQRQMQFPHSLGLLYSAFTYYCGFKVNSGEYKLMGLAPYGRPIYADLILKHLLDLKEDGSFRMNMDYFNYCQGLTMTNDRFAALLGGPPRDPESMLEQHQMDVAASIQKVTEEIMLRMARTVQRETKMKHLVLAGGVALNCVANGRVLREGPFDDIWIQPAAGDAGGALGAALFTWHHLLDKPRQPGGRDSQQGSWLGPRYSNDAIARVMGEMNAPHERFEDETELLETVAQAMSEGKIVGWFHGRMEFGPRALGARSIIGDARNSTMQAAMNLKIKFRESFRPFAPCVLQERVHEYFDMKPGQESPYMLLVAPVLEKHRKKLSDADREKMEKDPDLRARVNFVRSTIPAVTHVDYSARVQTVDEARHGRYYRLIKTFERLTGCPVIVNTSFNVRGEPIVCTPEEAYRCFLATDMDMLVLEDFVLRKERIERKVSEAEREKYLAQFQLD
jgi:carbamoyltransferase